MYKKSSIFMICISLSVPTIIHSGRRRQPVQPIQTASQQSEQHSNYGDVLLTPRIMTSLLNEPMIQNFILSNPLMHVAVNTDAQRSTHPIQLRSNTGNNLNICQNDKVTDSQAWQRLIIRLRQRELENLRQSLIEQDNGSKDKHSSCSCM